MIQIRVMIDNIVQRLKEFMEAIFVLVLWTLGALRLNMRIGCGGGSVAIEEIANAMSEVRRMM